MISRIKNKFQQKSTRTIAENFLSLGVIKFFDLLVPLLVVPLLISKVGLVNYGKYAFAYSFIFYFLNVTQYGFSLSAVRDISVSRDRPSEVNRIFNEVFTTKLYLTIVVLTILTLTVLFVPIFQNDSKLYIYLSLMIIGDLLSPNWFFQGIEKMKFITLINMVSKSTYILLIFLLVKNYDDYYLIGLAQSSGFMIAGCVSLVFALKKFGLKYRISPLSSVFIQLKGGVASFLTMITPLLYANTSVFLTGIFGLPIYVSYVEIATKVTGAFSAINGIMTQVFYPYVNRKGGQTTSVKKLFIVTGFFTSVCMFFVAEFLLNIWLSGKNDEIVSVVEILSISPLLLAISSAYGVNGLMVLRKDKVYLYVIIVSSILGLFAALILIPIFTYTGAAYVIVFSRMAISIGCLYFYRKITHKIW